MSTTRTSGYMVSPSDEILGSKLPSRGQSLAYFLHRHQSLKETVREAANRTVEKVEEFWTRARLPTQDKGRAAKKVEALFDEWKRLKKNKNRTSTTQTGNEDAFKKRLEDLLDIAHGDAMSLITIPEDRAFLLAQREPGRRGTMAGADMALDSQEKKKRRRDDAEEKRRGKASEEAEVAADQVELASSTSSSSELSPLRGAVGPGPSTSTATPPPRKRGRTTVITPQLSAMLDRNKLSDRSAMMVVTETARTLGHSIEGLALNRSTIRRQRRTHREAKASAIMDDFKLTTPVIVHWDGKIMQDLKVKEQVDRLPVLVSSMGTSKLLGAPKIGAGTGQAQAQAVVSLLKKWNLEDTVRGLCFDTTASNTGRSNGACMLIEQALGLDLLYFACRHHVHELVLAAAFKAALGGTSGPDVLLFKRFQTQWVFIDREKWEDGLSHEETAGILAGRSDELAEFFTGHLSEHQPRDDYKELLDLCLLFLGAHPSPPSFRAPGTVHHARWMAKAIYCIKIWMFRGQFQLTAKEERGLRDLALFVVTMYAKPWFLAPNVLRAAHTDLDLLKALLNYPQHAIGKATTKKLAGHAWYLSEDLVGLAIFDETLPDGEREALRDALAKEGEEHPPKRPSIDLDGLPNKRLADFASQKSKEALTMLGLHVDVLRDPVGTWSSRDDYQAARTMAATLACTNDHAERAVALVQEFSGKLTAEEEQVQWALQVVEENRAKYPDAKKATLLN